MNPTAAVAICVALFVAMLAGLEIGFRIGRRDQSKALDRDARGVFETAILALFALLLAFTFAGAMDRFATRRALIIREASAIATVYYRVDVLPRPYRDEMRGLLHGYMEVRRQVVDHFDPRQGIVASLRPVLQMHKRIWEMALEASRSDDTQNTSRLLLPALNELIEVSMARAIMSRAHVPSVILLLLLAVALFTSLLAGYGMARSGRRSPLHGLLYTAAVCLTIYVGLDLDNPAQGLIQLEAAEKLLRDLLQGI